MVAQELINHAQAALETAKEQGRNHICLAEAGGDISNAVPPDR